MGVRDNFQHQVPGTTSARWRSSPGTHFGELARAHDDVGDPSAAAHLSLTPFLDTFSHPAHAAATSPAPFSTASSEARMCAEYSGCSK